MNADDAWTRRFEAHYNFQFYIESAKRYHLLNTLIEGVAVVCSSAAAYLWFLQNRPDLAGGLALVAASLSAVVISCRLPAKAVRYDYLAKLWFRLVFMWDDLDKRAHSDHPPARREFEQADREFRHLFEQELDYPSARTQNRIYATVSRRLGCETATGTAATS